MKRKPSIVRKSTSPHGRGVYQSKGKDTYYARVVRRHGPGVKPTVLSAYGFETPAEAAAVVAQWNAEGDMAKWTPEQRKAQRLRRADDAAKAKAEGIKSAAAIKGSIPRPRSGPSRDGVHHPRVVNNPAPRTVTERPEPKRPSNGAVPVTLPTVLGVSYVFVDGELHISKV